MKRVMVLSVLVSAGALAMTVAGLASQQPQAPQELQIEKVKDNLYMITGAGGNTAAYVIANGVVLVDTKNPNNGQKILDKVKSVTDKPITHIINTHTHADHVGSNEFFPPAVEIIVQERTAANMKAMANFKDPAKSHGLPDRTFGDRLTVLSGNESIDLYYFGPAHTNGDAFVVFRSLRVMHAGDAFSGPTSPLIDTNNGGSGVNYPVTFARAAVGITNVDTVIPGHSAVTTWQAFLDYGEFMGSFVNSARAAIQAGKSPEQALGEFKPGAKFEKYNLGRAKANIDVVYKELQK